MTLTSPYTQPNIQPWMNMVHPGIAAREQERTTRQFFVSSQRGAALRAPISTPALQRALAGLAQPLLCPSYSSLNRKNFLSVLFDGRDQLLSANSLTAAKHAAVFNKLLFCRQFQRIRSRTKRLPNQQ